MFSSTDLIPNWVNQQLFLLHPSHPPTFPFFPSLTYYAGSRKDVWRPCSTSVPQTLLCPGGSGVKIQWPLMFPRNISSLDGVCANSSHQQPPSSSALTFLSHNYTSSSVGPVQSLLLRAGCFYPSLQILWALITGSCIGHNISVENVFPGWVFKLRSDIERKACTSLFLDLPSAAIKFCD